MGQSLLPMFHLTWEILPECQQHGITLLVRKNSRSSECPCRQSVKETSAHRHRMVSTSQHSVTNILYLVHSHAGPVRNSSQQHASRPHLRRCNKCFTKWCTCISVACYWSLLFSTAVASNTTRVASGLSSGDISSSMPLETTSVNSIPQPPRTSVHVERANKS